MNQSSKTYHSDYNDQGKLDKLCWDGADRIEDIYHYFNIDIKYKNDQVIKSSCPVHGGDNPVACNMYPAGDQVVHWKCRTHNCEDHFGKTMIGFIKGCLSRQRYDWSKIGDKEASFKDAVDFLLKITHQNFGDIKDSDDSYVEMMKFNNMIWTMVSDNNNLPDNAITRDFYIKNINIPAQYYVDRNFSKEVLIKYDVGFCNIRGRQMYNRAIVPIYDPSHTYAVGFTGRSIFDQCKKCLYYHDPSEKCKFFPKWKHSKGFAKEKWLYNYWYAKDVINKTKTAILVESPGNVWRLEESGFHNSLGLFGTSLNAGQKDLLDQLNIMNLIILMDNDEAGKNAGYKIQDLCQNTYNTILVNIPKNDIADLTTKEVQYFLTPIMKDLNYG
jgi:5S rRNA maturation endonuclease (ribonuclease M5)